jgi:hypothetical protein
MKHFSRIFLSALCAILGVTPLARAQAFVDVEGGAAFTGYNDLAIPADDGTRVSLKDDIKSSPAPALRVRLGYTFSKRHTVSALVAPLTVYGSGKLDRDVMYQGMTFEEGSNVNSVYRFDSYRLTYRYSFIDTDKLTMAAGITGKIRSADIALMSRSAYAHRSDLGVVPLINFQAQWGFRDPLSFIIDADALASPYGRAEDVLAALQYAPAKNVTWRIGYRILEGGSDGGGNVYTFALFHYATAGVRVTF